jgi:very-short-patch-repair endonuclease
MEEFICKECQKPSKTLKGLSSHRFQKHGIKPKQTYNEYVLKGVSPTCGCGCGEEPKFLTITNGYREYIRGHAARVNNNWGHNPEAIRKSHETQKHMYASGELEIWNKGLDTTDPRVKKYGEAISNNKERGEKISKALSGVPKSDEHKKKIKEHAIKRWESTEEREKQSKLTIKRLIKNNYRNPKTKLEESFENILGLLGIKNKYQFDLDLGIFDFYLYDYKMLIEVDGDFHHCNPNVHGEPKYPIQFNTIKNDKRKNKIAEDNNVKLLRFWEYDIKNNPEEVIKIIKQELNL